MRYSSSKAYASSSSSSSSYSGYTGTGSYGASASSSTYSSQPTAAASNSSYYSASAAASPTQLHYKKDGTLDMRYNSSYSALAAASPTIPKVQATSDELHYKKDGTLDMRYNSSYSASAAASPTIPKVQATSDELHYKKDGTLDMRYKSSQNASAAASPTDQKVQKTNGELHYKKDGTLDMRFSSSKLENFRRLQIGEQRLNSTTTDASIPSDIPKTKQGCPDMRNPKAKEWVQQEAAKLNSADKVPSWIPKKKDGTVDYSKPITKIFMAARRQQKEQQCNQYPDQQDEEFMPREQYYVEKQKDEDFNMAVYRERQMEVDIPPELPLMPNYDDVDVPLIDFESMDIDKSEELGHGSFGMVYKGRWNGFDIAVKCLHIQKLTKHEKDDFVKEIEIHALLGNHNNIVYLHGYCLEPPTLVMEYVQLGSLNFLLHYCTDKEIEIKMTDGRIKKRILIGIAQGMVQLHATRIIHGDLKPQNILITDDYTAKIADFGLARLRAKTSTSVSSKVLDGSGEGGARGTAAYMAPELLDGGKRTNEKTDVYSFGVLMNELVQETEPFYECYDEFHGKGPYAAAMHAKAGHRPAVASKTPKAVESLIKVCWASDHTKRPPFDAIAKTLRSLEISNSF